MFVLWGCVGGLGLGLVVVVMWFGWFGGVVFVLVVVYWVWGDVCVVVGECVVVLC